MADKLFEIKCTTCEKMFSVNDSELIGQIIACPVCGGMIYISPPYGYQSDKNAPDEYTIPIAPGQDDNNDLVARKASFAVACGSDAIPQKETNNIAPPVSYEPPVTGTPPVSYEPPVTGTLPISNEPPVTDAPPVSYESPVTGTPPISNEIPVTGTLPISNEPPVTDAPPISYEIPVIDTLPVSNEPPITGTIPVSNEPPIASELTPKNDSVFGSIYFWLLILILIILAAILTALLFSDPHEFPDNNNPAADQQQLDPAPPAQGIAEHTNKTDTEKKDAQTVANAKENSPIEKKDTAPALGKSSGTDPNINSAEKQNNTNLSQMNTAEDGQENIPSLPAESKEENAKSIDKDLLKEDLIQKNSESKPEEKTHSKPTGSSPVNKTSEKIESLDPEDEFASTTLTTRSSFQSFLPKLKKEEPVLNIKERLKTPFKQLSYSKGRLSGLLRIFSAISGVPITIDLDYIDLLRPMLKTVPSLEIRNGITEDAVKQTADLLKTEIRSDPDGLVLTIPALEKAMTFVEYDLTDLIQKTAADAVKETISDHPEDHHFLPVKLTSKIVAELIVRLTDPSSWNSAGGKGEIKLDGDYKFSVHQTKNIQVKINRLIEQIRMIRGLEPKKEISTQEIIPETLGWEKLSEKMTLNFLDKVSLTEVCASISKASGLQIFIDEAAILTSGVQAGTAVNVHFNDVPADQILTTILKPLQLNYIILADDTIMITSQSRALAHTTVEIHLFALPDGKHLTSDELKTLPDRIRSEIAPQTWVKSVKGPNPDSVEGGIIIVDPVSCCLFTRQSQPIQRQISQWLDRNISDREHGITSPTNQNGNVRKIDLPTGTDDQKTLPEQKTK